MFVSPSLLGARTWRVEVDGSGDAPTIQAAIDSSASGDLVLVGPGRYFEHLNFNGKNIWLKSFAGPEVTILDGNNAPGAVIKLYSGETRDAVVDGFTITQGTGEPLSEGAESRSGGGIRILNAWPTIVNCVFNANVPTGPKPGGGAITYSVWPHGPSQPLLIKDNIFLNNTGFNGGGLVIARDAEIVGNSFFRNTATTGDGGAILVCLVAGGTVFIRNNQFWENTAGDHGGAIELGGVGRAFVDGNLFVRNSAMGAHGSGDRGAGGAISVRPLDAEINNNTFWRNSGVGPHTCRSGGILLDFGGDTTVNIHGNILAECQSCAIRIIEPVGLMLNDNLFWNNTPQSTFDDNTGSLPGNWMEQNVFEDPQFCGANADNFTVSIDSPALSHPNGPIGAFTRPGCGPGVPVSQITWGTLKMKFE